MVSRETPLISVQNISKHFDETVALNDLSLTVAQGEVLSLLGPSGSGKSTLLRVIAGLTEPDRGSIYLNGEEINEKPAYQRGFGMMFQQFALFPHRTVAQNIAFGLEMQGWDAARRRDRISEMLALVGLTGYDERTIFELSGGEQQRVALARSLAPSPSLLLLDEPLGSLDRRLRERLVEELRTILNQVGTTAIYVTHDQQEAFTISDRLALMAQGQIMQAGPPESLYRQPNSRFVAEFFALTNIVPIHGIVERNDRQILVESAIGSFVLPADAFRDATMLVIRPEAATITSDRASHENVVRGIAESWSFRGNHYRLVTQHDDVGRLEWEIRLPEGTEIKIGDNVSLLIESSGMSLLPD